MMTSNAPPSPITLLMPTKYYACIWLMISENNNYHLNLRIFDRYDFHQFKLSTIFCRKFTFFTASPTIYANIDTVGAVKVTFACLVLGGEFSPLPTTWPTKDAVASGGSIGPSFADLPSKGTPHQD